MTRQRLQRRELVLDIISVMSIVINMVVIITMSFAIDAAWIAQSVGRQLEAPTEMTIDSALMLPPRAKQLLMRSFQHKSKSVWMITIKSMLTKIQPQDG